MAAVNWQWEEATKRYRSKDTGRFLSQQTVRDLRDGWTETQKQTVTDLAGKLASQQADLAAWEGLMREHIKTVFVAEAALGRGGRNAMSAQDWGYVGSTLKEQYSFLRGFTEEIGRGTLSEGQIAARGQLYIAAATQAFERARASSYSALILDQYPGDGQTACVSNCRCFLTISESDERWDVTWHTSSGESCPDCEEMARAWNPLVVEKSDEEGRAAVTELVHLNGKALHRAARGVQA
jgi:hypothetical protein